MLIGPQSLTTKIAVSLLLLALAMAGQFRLVDQQASAQINKTLQTSLITFAVARGLNGAISVVQGTEIALEPGGVGINLAVGEILDPINDLVERFSWVMLASSTSLGIQTVLLNLSTATAISIGLIGLCILTLVLLWVPGLTIAPARHALFRTLVVFCFARFAVIAIVMVNHQISVYFLDQQIAASTEVLAETSRRIQQVGSDKPAQQTEPATGVKARVQQFFNGVTDTFDATKKLEYYKKISAEAVGHIIELSALFIVQTVLIPLIFLWGLTKILRYLLTNPTQPGRHT